MLEKITLEAGIYIVSTPIGNIEDITLRALKVLASCDVLVCEDTRITRKLYQYYKIPAPKFIIACHEHNEEKVSEKIVGYVLTGYSVAICSDSGMPVISDPGFKLISMAQQEKVKVTVLPGANAALTGLILSGFPSQTFLFLGFLSRKPQKLKKVLVAEKDTTHTLILYESPHRLEKLLLSAREVFSGDRRVAVCLEVTKKFERCVKGTLDELCNIFKDKQIKGEITVVIAGNTISKTTTNSL